MLNKYLCIYRVGKCAAVDMQVEVKSALRSKKFTFRPCDVKLAHFLTESGIVAHFSPALFNLEVFWFIYEFAPHPPPNSCVYLYFILVIRTFCVIIILLLRENYRIRVVFWSFRSKRCHIFLVEPSLILLFIC